MQGDEGLHPSSNGKRIAFDGCNCAVIHGPFTAVSELVPASGCGASRTWMRQSDGPGAAQTDVRAERAGDKADYEAEDFGEALTPEIAEREQRMREQVEGAKGS